MSANRRKFVLGSSIGLAALLAESGEFDLEAAQIAAVHDPAALEFWTRGMGVPASDIPGASQIKGGPATVTKGSKAVNDGPGMQSFGQEPLFVHYHEGDHVFIPSDQMPKSYLLESGDTQVSAQMQRLRLNVDDNGHYAKFTSGGIYLELQQGQQAAATAPVSNSAMGQSVVQFASSVFSAFAPGSGKAAAAAAQKTPAKATGTSQFLQSPPAGGKTSGAAGTPISLQTKNQAQSLAFPGGAGKAAFSAFVKDPRKTAFGQVLAALVTSGSATAPLYAQLLTIPLLAAGPGLNSVRAIVANLQIQGSSQQILMQSPPTDIATTADAMNKLNSALPLRAGDYLVVRREHPGVTLNDINKYKLLNGFLVPKDVQTEFDATPEVVSAVLPALSYLTVRVGVQKGKANACAVQTSA